MPKKIYKELINYSCPDCLKNFGNKKGNYLYHINRKNPCVKIPPPSTAPAPPTPPFQLHKSQYIPICIEVNKSVKKINKELEKKLEQKLYQDTNQDQDTNQEQYTKQ
jgi:hypothetical protein